MLHTPDGPPIEVRGLLAILATPPKHLTRGELEWAFERLIAENAKMAAEVTELKGRQAYADAGDRPCD